MKESRSLKPNNGKRLQTLMVIVAGVVAMACIVAVAVTLIVVTDAVPWHHLFPH